MSLSQSWLQLSFIVLDLHHCIARLKNRFRPSTASELPSDSLLDSDIMNLSVNAKLLNEDRLTCPEILAHNHESFIEVQGHSDSPNLHGTSNMTATMTTDSASSTPCPSPQLRSKAAPPYRMSVAPNRRHSYLQAVPGLSIHSKRELYNLAMAPSDELEAVQAAAGENTDGQGSMGS